MQTASKTIELVLPSLHPAQQRIINEARRFNVLACGRRFGKTTLGIDLVIDKALDGYPVGWFSPTYKMLGEVWKEIIETTKQLQTRVAKQEHRIELLTGGVIDCWSLDAADSVRGRKYARVIVDEAAMVPNLGDAWQAAIRPTLTDYEGDAFFLSTPKGINFFHECYSRGVDGTQPDWAAWHSPTLDNPHIKPTEIEAARQELPEQIFRQEYLAEFLQNSGAVFRNIDACLRPDTGDHKGHQLFAGVDWGQKNDFTVISVICGTCRQEVELDRFNKIEWADPICAFPLSTWEVRYCGATNTISFRNNDAQLVEFDLDSNCAFRFKLEDEEVIVSLQAGCTLDVGAVCTGSNQ